MKKILFTLGLMIVSYGVFAQDAGDAAVSKAMSRATHSRDFLLLTLTYDKWAGNGSGGINTRFNRGFSVAFMYDYPLTKTHISLAAGLGIATSGIFLKDQKLDLTNTDSDVPDFSDVASGTYKKFKIATTYLEIPVEIRYRQVADNANKGFKVALGVKVGNLLNAHTKARTSLVGSNHTEKISDKRIFNTWRFAGTARIGYGNWALFGSYNLNPLFKDNSQYDIRPYQIGIALSGL